MVSDEPYVAEERGLKWLTPSLHFALGDVAYGWHIMGKMQRSSSTLPSHYYSRLSLSPLPACKLRHRFSELRGASSFLPLVCCVSETIEGANLGCFRRGPTDEVDSVLAMKGADSRGLPLTSLYLEHNSWDIL